ncbi:MAG TPA: V-type ATP synthase subunit E [Vicinamibacteria bacterium]|nr:V-type ATP synthase subunit E [Vicinamibacteria bacterium]
MALAELLAHIEERARAEIEQELERGRCEASRLRIAAEERTARAREERLAAEEVKLRRELDPDLAQTRLGARRLVAEARRRFAARVLAEVERRLPGIAAGSRYRECLPGQLEDCLAYADGERVTIRGAPSLAELVGDRPGVRYQADPDVTTGFIVETEDGALVVDGTLKSRLESMKAELEIELFRRWESNREAGLG